MTHRGAWIAKDMSGTQRGSGGSPLLSGAHLEQEIARRAAGEFRLRKVSSVAEHESVAPASGISHSPVMPPWLSLPPVKGHKVSGGSTEVEGAHMKAGAAGVGSDSGHAVGLLGGQEERGLPVTLPEVVEDEEQEDDSDPYSTWHALYDPFVTDEVDDHPSSRWAGRSPRSSDPTEPQSKGSQKKKKKRKRKERAEEDKTGKGDKRGKGKNRRPKQSSRDCRVEKREMKVRDLGLGFDSDEIVLFKFCVGSCQSLRTNYDLALKALQENGSLPRRKVSSHPCCRPDRYESVSFMDAQTTWRTIQSLSAASCMCMG
ncbi:putative artemin-like [Scophthalmus maximus]|uniref:Putative artemin-like n=1 Tax=Scophthalmus maximus TaxID=52904 RepID=A0A2U9BLK5_SCOMX|nr:putative artemin-like [Scophthalmus maximus]